METLKRSEQKLEDTWNLEIIYKNLEEYNKDFQKVKNLLDKIQIYQGHILDSSNSLYECLSLDTEIDLLLERLRNYTQRKYDEDISNTSSQNLKGRYSNLSNEFSNITSFIVPELLEKDYKVIEKYISENPKLKRFELDLKKVFRYKEHTLAKNEEMILSELSQCLDYSDKIAKIIRNSEMQFGKIKDENGNEVQLTNQNYNLFIRSKNRQVRHDAFMEMYNTYSKYKNTLATCLEGNVAAISKINKIEKYPNSRYAALYKTRVSEEIYDNLIEIVNKRIDVLHKYYNLKKGALNLDELNLYDIFLNISTTIDKKYTFNEAKEILLDVVKIFGDEYLEKVKQILNNRYIDVYPNENKRSGAYSSFGYDTPPYILLNYQETYADVLTLIHEIGHAMHTIESREHNDYLDYRYKIFLAEVASTVNETLFNYYMLEHTTNNIEKQYIISEMLDKFKKTFFNQTMYAEFEQLIYNSYENGLVLTSKYLSDKYLELNRKYYGNSVNVNEEIKYEWARIPHLYYNFYVYKYATGISAAYYIVNRIRNKEKTAIEDYLKFLRVGDTLDPLEALKLTGADMTGGDVINTAIDMFDNLIDECKVLRKNN